MPNDRAADGPEVDRTMDGLLPIPDNQGMESTPAELHQKPGLQLARGGEKEVFNHRDISPGDSSRHIAPMKKRKLWYILAACIVLLIIAVAVAVPLGLRNKHTTASSATTSPHAKNTSSIPPSQKASGALNGTGMAILNTATRTAPNLHLFYQDSLSNLRRLEKQNGASSSFTGGPDLPVIASDARNGTPMTYLFYIDTAHNLQEIISDDNLTTWRRGPLGDSKIPTSTSATALTAFTSAKSLGHDNATSVGMRLYYGAPDDQVHEVVYVAGGQGWLQTNFNFANSNGNAGIASAGYNDDEYSDHTTPVLFTVNTTNSLKRWDLDLGGKNAPYGIWEENPDSGPDALAPNSSLIWAFWSLEGGDCICYQNVLLSIGCTGLEFEHWDASYPNPVKSKSWLLGFYGQDVQNLNVFFQTNGSDITQNLDISDTWLTSELAV
ncbi:MAG: hypothetical protein Q9218_004388 [Villophora microphyllina]